MKILEITESFPDARVEKTIQSELKFGHKVSALGINLHKKEVVPDQHEVNVSTKEIVFNTKKANKKIQDKIKEIDPDLIHVHNIFFAQSVAELNFPFIYNDHEAWSLQERANHSLILPWNKEFLKKKFTMPYRYLKFKHWEKRIFKKAKAVIVVNVNLQSIYETKCKNVITIPNCPPLSEVKPVWKKALESQRDFDTVYVGNDFRKKSMPMRQSFDAYKALQKSNLKVLLVGEKIAGRTKNFESVGWVDHSKIYEYLVRAKTGLIPWKHNDFHKYINPNKYYMYLHSGALPLLPMGMQTLNDPLSVKINDTKNIVEIINQNKNSHEPEDMIKIAKIVGIWENYEDQLKDVLS